MKRLSLTEKRLNVVEDPRFSEKQEIILQMTEILKCRTITSTKRYYSILEDALMLCVLFNHNLRQQAESIYELKVYERIKLQFNLHRSFEAYKRRFQHLKLFEWSVDNLDQLYTIISQDIPLDHIQIKYNIVTKVIQLPDVDGGIKRIDESNMYIAQFAEVTEDHNNELKQLIQPKTDLISQLSLIMDVPIVQLQQDYEEYQSNPCEFIKMLLKAMELSS